MIENDSGGSPVTKIQMMFKLIVKVQDDWEIGGGRENISFLFQMRSRMD